jgi:hypothetical protein
MAILPPIAIATYVATWRASKVLWYR